MGKQLVILFFDLILLHNLERVMINARQECSLKHINISCSNLHLITLRSKQAPSSPYPRCLLLSLCLLLGSSSTRDWISPHGVPWPPNCLPRPRSSTRRLSTSWMMCHLLCRPTTRPYVAPHLHSHHDPTHSPSSYIHYCIWTLLTRTGVSLAWGNPEVSHCEAFPRVRRRVLRCHWKGPFLDSDRYV